MYFLFLKKVLAQTDLSKIVNEMPAPLLDKISDEDIELFIQFIARRIEDLEHIEEYAKQVFCRR
ncbi:hypothetical protein MCOL2_08791 [Listeria fleischmannii FSL S10-1203]|uniref:Uncharacterized protein n=1 Tax=Listeria fleischmannii FSL S10-1203 TaxID=1265822 RepID=W7DNB7_9LIST|nr:hypothetical protein MCOL2_08791 [Listeria fleischmannii FSL S10-1203]